MTRFGIIVAAVHFAALSACVSHATHCETHLEPINSLPKDATAAAPARPAAKSP